MFFIRFKIRKQCCYCYTRIYFSTLILFRYLDSDTAENPVSHKHDFANRINNTSKTFLLTLTGYSSFTRPQSV